MTSASYRTIRADEIIRTIGPALTRACLTICSSVCRPLSPGMRCDPPASWENRMAFVDSMIVSRDQVLAMIDEHAGVD